MSRQKRNKRNKPSAPHTYHGQPARSKAPRADAGARGPEYIAAAAIGLLSWMHMSSVVSEFQITAGLHRWMMTYAQGFHRRGLVGTLFQFFFGDLPRAQQIAIASNFSAFATFLWLLASLALLFYAVFRLRDRTLRLAALAFAALALINPMWTTRAFDNGYTDWLAGLAVVGALAAFLAKRPLLSGAAAAFGIVGYWGTIFVWLPLGGLIALLMARDALAHDAPNRLRGLLAAAMRREAFALYLPLAAAVLSALANDNAAAIAELERIGGQENIIEQSFGGIGGAIAGNLRNLFVVAGSVYFALWLLYALPPLLASCLLIAALRRRGLRLLPSRAADITAAAVASQLPLLFLVVAFDWARLTMWTYTGFFIVAVVWLTRAQPAAETDEGDKPGAARGRLGALSAAPLAFALFSLTTPTLYAWYDMNFQVPCKRFCFKERTPQAGLLDAYRRNFISSPIDYYHSPGALTPAPREMQSENGARIVREGRDPAGAVMALAVVLNDTTEGVTVRAPRQTQRAFLGRGRYRLRIAYRSEGVAEANAATQFHLRSRSGRRVLLRAALPPFQREYSTIIAAPPGLAGNLFGWTVNYSGKGVFELHEVSLQRIGE